MIQSRAGYRAVALRFVIAYLLLTTFWAGASMRETALSWLGIDARGLDAPGLFGGLAEITGISILARWPGWLFDVSSELVGEGQGREHLGYALASFLGAVCAPLLLTRVLGPKRPFDFGVRAPPRELWLLTGAALLVLIPLSALMARHPEFQAEVQARSAGSPLFLVAVLVGGTAEHFFFHGVLLAWLHPSGRFPTDPLIGAPLLWPARRISGRRVSLKEALLSLRIPRHCALACLLSAPLFFCIHTGKPDAELWLSALAGPVLAWLAYRTGGFVAPLVIHLAASGFAVLMLLFSL